MNLCNNDHDEVCYEGRVCPVCDKMTHIESLKDDIATLEKEIEELKDSQ